MAVPVWSLCPAAWTFWWWGHLSSPSPPRAHFCCEFNKKLLDKQQFWLSHFPECVATQLCLFLSSHLWVGNKTVFWTHPIVAYELHSLDLHPRTQRPLAQTFPVAHQLQTPAVLKPTLKQYRKPPSKSETPHCLHILVSQLLFPRIFWIISASKLSSTLQIRFTAWQALGRPRELRLSKAFFIYKLHSQRPGMLFNTVEPHLRSHVPCVCSLPAVLQTKVWFKRTCLVQNPLLITSELLGNPNFSR